MMVVEVFVELLRRAMVGVGPETEIEAGGLYTARGAAPPPEFRHGEIRKARPVSITVIATDHLQAADLSQRPSSNVIVY